MNLYLVASNIKVHFTTRKDLRIDNKSIFW